MLLGWTDSPAAEGFEPPNDRGLTTHHEPAGVGGSMARAHVLVRHVRSRKPCDDGVMTASRTFRPVKITIEEPNGAKLIIDMQPGQGTASLSVTSEPIEVPQSVETGLWVMYRPGPVIVSLGVVGPTQKITRILSDEDEELDEIREQTQ